MSILDKPARTQRQTYNANMTIKERMTLEGVPYTTFGFSENQTFTADGNINGGFSSFGVTQAIYIENFVVSSSKNCRIQIQIYDTGTAGTSNSIDTLLWNIQVAPGIPVTVPVGVFIRPSGVKFTTTSVGGWKVRAVYDTDKTGVNTFVYATGYRLTDDLNFSAEKVYWHIGDSITAGGTGPTNKTKQYDWQILDYLRSQGHSIRMLNTSVSGTTAAFHDTRRAMGGYELPQADFIAYSLGTNDASGGTTAAAFKTNIASIITHKQTRHPNAKMLILGATPRESDTVETALALLRTAASQAVAEANDPNVKYLSLGSAFDRKLVSNYASSDPANDHTHPSDAGHASTFAVIKSFMDANPSFRP